MRSSLPVVSTGKLATITMAGLHSAILIVQSCCSRFVDVGHRPEPSRGFAMGEIVRDAATAQGVIEQGALLDVHPVSTRKGARWSHTPCRETGKTGKIFKRSGNTR